MLQHFRKHQQIYHSCLRFDFVHNPNLGTPVDSKYINIEPTFVTMTSTHVFAASKEVCFVWHFRTAKSWTHLTLGKVLNHF